MVMSVKEGMSDDSDLLVLYARCSEIQRKLRMGKSKRGRASSSLYTPGPLGLNIDLLLWYHFVHYFHWLPQPPLACDYCALLRRAAHWSRSIVLCCHVIIG